ncbi:MAG: HD domain-containing protein [Candidatus Peribacteraceae bacterium]
MKRAFELGKQAHTGQKRKSGEPYFTHPVAVAQILAGMGADTDTLIVALLHDTMEDTQLTYDNIEQEFDGSVAQLIESVTKLDKQELQGKPTLEEETETLRKIFTCMNQDVRTMIIKLVDRLHNMQTAEFLGEKRSREMAKETMDVYVKIADRLCMSDLRDELEALCLGILEPELFTALSQLRHNNEKPGQDTVAKMRTTLQQAAPALFKKTTVFYEHKSWQKLQAQYEAEGTAITGVSSVTAVFVCQNIDACYHVLGTLHQTWQRETLSFEDYINAPQINGNRGLHSTIILEHGIRVRCKIRTQEMHEYAHKGITTQCFDSEPIGLLEYLPWTQRIVPLAEDTADRSTRFWESLQSDILGASITIHGPNDKTVALPLGATALDGALYLFPQRALKVRIIRVNGKEVAFSTPLAHGASLAFDLADKTTVQREWLDWANTAFAVAKIRSALSEKSTPQKIRIGKQLLRETLTKQKKGFIEEFESASIVRGFARLGYSSLEDMYIAIADGHLEPIEVSSALFAARSRSASSPGSQQRHCILRYTFSLDDPIAVCGLTQHLLQFHSHFRSLHLRKDASGNQGHMTVKALLSPEQEQQIIRIFQAAGARNIEIVAPSPVLRSAIGIGLITALWGLDPVIAYLLIHQHNLSAVDMTLVRFWSLTGISAILLMWQKLRDPLTETPLPLRNKSLWASVVFLVSISLCTYASLQLTAPSHYTIPMTAAGVMMTTIVHRRHWRILLVSWILLIIGNVFLIVLSPLWPWQSILATFGTVGAFTAFSIVSEQYKKTEHVAARSAQYFFILSVLCFLLTLPLLPFSTVAFISGTVLTQMILFSIVLVGLPYYLYYFYLTHREIDVVLRYSFLIIFASVIGQALIIHTVAWHAVLISGSLVILGAILPLVIATMRAKRPA